MQTTMASKIRVRPLLSQLSRKDCSTARIAVKQARLSSDWSHLDKELRARQIPATYDYLVPTPSHLLNIALADILPRASDSSRQSGNGGGSGTNDPRRLPNTIDKASPLPPTQHLIYFPPAIPGKDLLADGTDPMQSPGEPFVRRMWAGGSVRLNNNPQSESARVKLDGGRAACIESIRDVTVKGKPGEEKVFVGIERRIGRCGERERSNSIRSRFIRDDEEDFGEAAIIERRNIVFMRERSKEQAVKDMEKAKEKMLMPPEGEPAYRVEVTPSEKLLFRYSALTYNAHAIHLDPQYCKEVEGHRQMLVHGPLSFTLAVTMLRRHLAQSTNGEEVVSSVEYRNLAPLYCHEPLRIAAKEKEKGKWDIWVETPEGGLALKGTVKTEQASEAIRKMPPHGDLTMLGFKKDGY